MGESFRNFISSYTGQVINEGEDKTEGAVFGQHTARYCLTCCMQ